MYKQKLYAKGGMCTGSGCPGCASCMADGGQMYAEGGDAKKKKSYSDRPHPMGMNTEELNKFLSTPPSPDDGYIQNGKAPIPSTMKPSGGKDKKPKKKMAHGGDVVDRIMMSRGGKVANETEIEADFAPVQFDDLVLRDDLDSSYSGDNSGDKLGNMAEDERERDMIARIMKSRAKKDKMPRPA